MNEQEKREIYEKSKIETKTIKIATTDPMLKDKIRSNMLTESDTVFWFLKFNLALDVKTVSKRTMNVTERNGYIVNTDISYDDKAHMISISPIDCYVQNEYYLLNISRKVKSAKGKRMKKEIHIIFKLVGNQITEFKVLSPSTTIPKPQKRPKGYVPQGELVYPKARVTNVYTFDESKFEDLPKDKLPYQIMKFNPLIAVLGLLAAIAGFAISNLILLLSALFVSMVGIAHIVLQFSRRHLRSVLTYNSGVVSFNRGSYAKAKKKFVKAAALDEENEYAEYATAKVEFYL